jgi:starvation-inducible DNA-binding protein
MGKENLIKSLNDILCDEAVYYQKLRNYHWNVKGPAFFQLHMKFEEMYTATALHVDGIAERVLALGGTPRSTLSSFLEHAQVKEDAQIPDANRMVGNLCDDIGTILGRIGPLKHQADELDDDSTVNLLDDIQDFHEENEWMLKAFLG